MKIKCLIVAAMVALVPMAAQAGGDVIGKTKLSQGFSLSSLVSSLNIVVRAFDDPKVPGVTCHVSSPEKSGFTMSDDPSASSIACRQTGQIVFKGATKAKPFGDVSTAEGGETVFGSEKGWTKALTVRRFVDTKRRVLVYVVYVEKWGADSWKNVISTISLYSQVQR